MKRKKIVISASVIVIAIALLLLAFAVVGNPAVLMNNHKLQKAITSIDTETVVLNEIVPFDWDFVYTFDAYLPKSEMEKILGFQSNSLRETVSEGMVQLVFVKGSAVVSSICGYGDSLGYTVSFATGNENFSRIASSDNAVFSVEKGDGIVRLLYIENNSETDSNIVEHTAFNIPENETLRVDSPDGAYRAEAYGTDKGITASGLYPYEGLRVIRNSDETTVWNTDGYYRAEFLWSGNSSYVAVYNEARIYGICFVVAANTGEVIVLPDVNTVSARLDVSAQPSANRPDPYFKAVEWVNDTTVRVNYHWMAQEGAKEVSGTYEYDIISGNILTNTSQINKPPG